MLSSAWSFIFSWYNLPFTLLLAACVVLAAMQFIGLGGDHDTDADAHADIDHDVDLAHDVDLDHGVDLDHAVDLDHGADLDHAADLDHDADLDHGIDHDLDHDLDHAVDHDVDHAVDHDAGGAPTVLNVLAFLGVGKAPLLVVLLMFFGSVGILGWILNSAVRGVFGEYPGPVFAAVLPITIVAGGFMSSRTARFIGRALPPISTTATRANALVGRRGTVISPFVDAKYGLVHLRDQSGTLINVFAVIRTEQESIKRGSNVVLVSYDPASKVYTITQV